MTAVVEKPGVPDSLGARTIGPITWVLVSVWVLILSGLAVWRVWSLGSGAVDLGFHVHALGAVARNGLAAPASWAGWSFLQDHFSPWLLPLAPLVATSWGGYVLVVAQVLCYGASILLVWRLLGRTSIDNLGRRVITLGYALAPALTFPLLFDSHSNVMAAPFVVLLLEGLIFDRRRQALFAGLAACGFREDVAILVGALAIVYAGQRAWVWLRLGVPVAVAVLAWRITASGRSGTGMDIVSGLDPRARGQLFFGYLSPFLERLDIGGAVGAIAEVLWANGLITLLAIAILLPWVLLGRLGLRPLAALVLSASPYLFADSLLTKSVGFQYWAIAPALMVAAVIDVKHRTLSGPRFLAFGGWVALAVVGGPFALGTLGPGGITVSSIIRGAEDRAGMIELAHSALACVPVDDSVAVISELMPLTGQFASVHLLPNPFAPAVTVHGNEVGEFPVVNSVWPDWVIAPDLPEEALDAYRQVEGNPMLWRMNSDTSEPTVCPETG